MVPSIIESMLNHLNGIEDQHLDRKLFHKRAKILAKTVDVLQKSTRKIMVPWVERETSNGVGGL